MDFDGNFRKRGECDVSALARRMADVADAEWSDDSWRQEEFETHQATETLPLLYDRDFRHEIPTRRPAYDRFGGGSPCPE